MADNPCWWGEPWVETWRRWEVCYIWGESSWIQGWNPASCMAGRSFTIRAARKPHIWWGVGRGTQQKPHTEGSPRTWDHAGRQCNEQREGSGGRGARPEKHVGGGRGCERASQAQGRAYSAGVLAHTLGDPPGRCLWWSSHPTCDLGKSTLCACSWQPASPGKGRTGSQRCAA